MWVVSIYLVGLALCSLDYLLVSAHPSLPSTVILVKVAWFFVWFFKTGFLCTLEPVWEASLCFVLVLFVCF